MLSSMASRPVSRAAVGLFILLWIFFAFAFLGGGHKEWYSNSVSTINDKFNSWTTGYISTDDDNELDLQPEAPPLNATIGGLEESLQDPAQQIENEPEKVSELEPEKTPEPTAESQPEPEPEQKGPISYQLDVPVKEGCEDVVSKLQLRLISEYRKLLKGVRYANIWGYLETENKGDAAIWAAQQILFSMMGIKFENACRFMSKGCDLKRFNATLRDHKPYSAIVMAGGGNFNDMYWEDQPSRMEMIDNYHDIPIRAFPQSIHMSNEDRIEQTKVSFGSHPNLQLAARDQPSYDWLTENLGQQALGGKEGPKNMLVPDIAFMWGNRPDFRTDTPKTHDILILARDDAEISAGRSSIPFGTGMIDLGGSIGNVTYNKVDWKFTHTPGIDQELPGYLKGKLQGGSEEKSEDQKKTDEEEEKKQQQQHAEEQTEQENSEDQSHENLDSQQDHHQQEQQQQQHNEGQQQQQQQQQGQDKPKENKDGEQHMEEYKKDEQKDEHKDGEQKPQAEQHSDNNNNNNDNSGEQHMEEYKKDEHKDGEHQAEQHSDNNNSNEEHKDQNNNNNQNSDHQNTKRGFKIPEISEFVDHSERGRNQRAWAKAIAGFELLGSAKFIVTDRLHGHIMSTIIGTPHVLMDSKLGKNLNFHNTWTQECECTRITSDFEESLDVARRYFESVKGREGEQKDTSGSSSSSSSSKGGVGDSR